jgi:DNA repair exonuclease SbcCD ATPase subunit
MKGWMRYRDEQVADFSEGRLIAVCGENGAGKSSIFDAMTFALYGLHRLGKQNVGDLIAQDCDLLSVEFEFEARGERYVVKRQRDRKGGENKTSGGTQGLWMYDEDGELVAVSGTEKDEQLARSIASIVRLSPEAFTSSFLLQQGEAARFIEAKPAERFAIVSGLIGLKEYEALEKAARQAQRDEKGRLDDVAARLREFEGVDDAALDRARAAAAAATAREDAAARDAGAAKARLADATRYARLLADVLRLDAEIATAGALIAARDEIVRDADMFEALAQTIEAVANVRDELAQAAEAAAAAAQAAGRAAAIDLPASDAAVQAATKRAQAAAKQLARAEKARDTARATERQASDFLRVADAILAGRARVLDFDHQLAEYDAMLGELPRIEKEAASLRAVVASLPELRQLGELRAQLEQMERDDPAGTLTSLENRRRQLEDERAACNTDAATADEALVCARRHAAESAAHAAGLAEQHAERTDAAGEATCRRCGQPIDAKHARAELRELAAQLTEAKRRAKEAATAERAAHKALAAARARLNSVDEALQATALSIARAAQAQDEHVRLRERDAAQTAAVAASAPPSIAVGVTSQATAASIAKLIAAHGDAPARASKTDRQLVELHGIDGRRATAVEERLRIADELAAREAQLDGRLAAVTSAREAHDTAAAAVTAAEAALAAARDEAESARAAVDVAREALTRAREERASLDAEAARAGDTAASHRGRAELHAASLPDGVREPALADPDAALARLEPERQRLAQAPGRRRALERAEQERIAAASRRDALHEQADEIPAGHRIHEAAAAAALNEAEAAVAAARDARTTAERETHRIEARIDELARLQEQRARSQDRWRRLKLLVKYLGKDGLQGALVADALATIASHANAFLQSLTGGQLRLELVRSEGDALELQAIDSSCMRTPRSAKALSGSQKFRCAVAVACGIGQYAGAGGMRSIVIDEGFGSLDESGQELMIGELKDLAQHMDKVIVVSHLDAFKDRTNFPDQIRVEAVGQTSRIISG